MFSSFIDGGSRGNPGIAGIGVVILKDNKLYHEFYKYIGKTSNNVAEYLALIHCLYYLELNNIRECLIHSDSELIVRQINGQYKVRHKDLIPLYNECMKYFTDKFKYKMIHIPREKNKRADLLANQAMDDGMKGAIAEPLPK